ncbi:MAG: putative quinol monooxygenase [Butyricimonas faecihominis]
MIRINVTVEVKSEVRAQVVELLREMSELSRQEKGCIG